MPVEIPPPESPPSLRLPDWPLPAYRYVPGLHPHPFRHPDGHLWSGGGPPPEEPWPGAWPSDPRFLRGLDLYDHRYWWEAHEVWEALWHGADRGSPEADLLQGLIQAAAFRLKAHMGEQAAAERLRARAKAKLEAVEARVGPGFGGLDLRALREGLG